MGSKGVDPALEPLAVLGVRFIGDTFGTDCVANFDRSTRPNRSHSRPVTQHTDLNWSPECTASLVD